jgi:hypothetical protein
MLGTQQSCRIRKAKGRARWEKRPTSLTPAEGSLTRAEAAARAAAFLLYGDKPKTKNTNNQITRARQMEVKA